METLSVSRPSQQAHSSLELRRGWSCRLEGPHFFGVRIGNSSFAHAAGHVSLSQFLLRPLLLLPPQTLLSRLRGTLTPCRHSHHASVLRCACSTIGPQYTCGVLPPLPRLAELSLARNTALGGSFLSRCTCCSTPFAHTCSAFVLSALLLLLVRSGACYTVGFCSSLTVLTALRPFCSLSCMAAHEAVAQPLPLLSLRWVGEGWRCCRSLLAPFWAKLVFLAGTGEWAATPLSLLFTVGSPSLAGWAPAGLLLVGVARHSSSTPSPFRGSAPAQRVVATDEGGLRSGHASVGGSAGWCQGSPPAPSAWCRQPFTGTSGAGWAPDHFFHSLKARALHTPRGLPGVSGASHRGCIQCRHVRCGVGSRTPHLHPEALHTPRGSSADVRSCSRGCPLYGQHSPPYTTFNKGAAHAGKSRSSPI